MSSYIPDPTDVTQPVGTVKAKTAAAEFRALKGYIATLLGLTVPNPFPAITVPSLNGGQLAGFRNSVKNGKMVIAQAGTTFTSPASGTYTLDGWVAFNTSAALLTHSQQSDVPTGDEFQFSLRAAVTTADAAIAAGDSSYDRHWIEGYDARQLVGRTFTVSFWMRSSKTGIHCVALKNTGNDRSYIAEVTVNVANTWEQKSFTVTGGLITAGTWNWTNGQGLSLDFVRAAGTTFHATAGTWHAGNFLSTSSQVNCLDTIGNIYAITGVQLEPGTAVTPFEHRPFSTELALCQRYFWKTFQQSQTPLQNTGSTLGVIGFISQAVVIWDQTVTFPVTMRTTPTFVTYSPNAASANWSTNVDTPVAAISNSGESGFVVRASTPGAAGRAYTIHVTASARL